MLALIVKLGPKIVGVVAKLLKSAKFMQVGSATVTTGLYAAVFNWKFAATIMAMLVIHEGGHILAAKYYGRETKGMYFIPFVGGVALIGGEQKSYWSMSMIALAGPFAGFLLTLVTFGLYNLTGEIAFAAAAGWMAVVNLLNLLPIAPLDGGWIVRALAFSERGNIGLTLIIAGTVIGLGLAWTTGVTLFLFLGAVGSFELITEWFAREIARGRAAVALEEPTLLDGWGKFLVIACYLGLAFFLSDIASTLKGIPGADIAHGLLKD